MIEWFGRLLPDANPVAVVSRPDPLPFHILSTRKRSKIAYNTIDISTPTLRIPSFKNRRLWWLDSIADYPEVVFSGSNPLITWNPFLASSGKLSASKRDIHFDILDDWSNHFAFSSMKDLVEDAYRSIFDVATSITVNSEGTLDLAHRFGRLDASLMTNGCDPERFSTSSDAQGNLTVGYVGKIGRRVDLDLVTRAASSLPNVNFVFAGPFLDREYEKPLRDLPNIEVLGDVHYDRVPELLQRFDIGWVPHRLGSGEVGGDVIKTYEYRAAGLPVLTTPVIGAGDRGLSNVCVASREDHVGKINEWAKAGARVKRVPEAIPEMHTWKHKSAKILDELNLL